MPRSSLSALLLTSALALCVGCRSPEAFHEREAWQGRWAPEGLSLSAGGLLEQSPAELRATFGASRPHNQPHWQGWSNLAARFIDRPDDDIAGPAVRACTFGFPMVMLQSPYEFEMLVTRRQTVLVFSGREVRHVYTDGRAMPDASEIEPSWWGLSIGRWAGWELRIETAGAVSPFWPGAKAGRDAVPVFIWNTKGFRELVGLVSSAARIEERMRLIDRDTIENAITIRDPSVLQRPWQITQRYRRVSEDRPMVHSECGGEDRNPVVDGVFTLAPR